MNRAPDPEKQTKSLKSCLTLYEQKHNNELGWGMGPKPMMECMPFSESEDTLMTGMKAGLTIFTFGVS